MSNYYSAPRISTVSAGARPSIRYSIASTKRNGLDEGSTSVGRASTTGGRKSQQLQTCKDTGVGDCPACLGARTNCHQNECQLCCEIKTCGPEFKNCPFAPAIEIQTDPLCDYSNLPCRCESPCGYSPCIIAEKCKYTEIECRCEDKACNTSKTCVIVDEDDDLCPFTDIECRCVDRGCMTTRSCMVYEEDCEDAPYDYYGHPDDYSQEEDYDQQDEAGFYPTDDYLRKCSVRSQTKDQDGEQDDTMDYYAMGGVQDYNIVLMNDQATNVQEPIDKAISTENIQPLTVTKRGMSASQQCLDTDQKYASSAAPIPSGASSLGPPTQPYVPPTVMQQPYATPTQQYTLPGATEQLYAPQGAVNQQCLCYLSAQQRVPTAPYGPTVPMQQPLGGPTQQYVPLAIAPQSGAPPTGARQSYAPSMGARQSYAPSMGARQSYAPSMGARQSYAPSMGARQSYAPSMGARQSYAPSMGARQSYAPSIGAQQSYAPSLNAEQYYGSNIATGVQTSIMGQKRKYCKDPAPDNYDTVSISSRRHSAFDAEPIINKDGSVGMVIQKNNQDDDNVLNDGTYEVTIDEIPSADGQSGNRIRIKSGAQVVDQTLPSDQGLTAQDRTKSSSRAMVSPSKRSVTTNTSVNSKNRASMRAPSFPNRLIAPTPEEADRRASRTSQQKTNLRNKPSLRSIQFDTSKPKSQVHFDIDILEHLNDRTIVLRRSMQTQSPSPVAKVPSSRSLKSS